MDALTEITEKLRRARQGDGDALGDLLKHFRAYLRVMAARDIDCRLARRVDVSDIVQQTCLSVHQRIREFDGESPAQFLAWVQKIQRRNVQDAARHQLHAQKRATDREEYVSDPQVLAADLSTPSQRVMRDEQAVRLASLLDELTEDQHEAVRLRFLEGCKLAEIAQRMERSEAAVAALVQRALATLRGRLPNQDSTDG